MATDQSVVLIVLSALVVVGAFWMLYGTHPRAQGWPTEDISDRALRRRLPRWMTRRRSHTP